MLALIFVWRVDTAVRTAYESGWKTSSGCGDCRLPSNSWVASYAIVAALAFAALLLALISRRVRLDAEAERPDRPGMAAPAAQGRATERDAARWPSWFVAGGAIVLVATGMVLRLLASVGHRGALNWILWVDVGVFLLLVALALMTTRLQHDVEPLTGRTRRFIQRQRINLLCVGGFVLVLNVLPQTSDQAVDSIRAWAVPDGRGIARLAFGLATALLLALVVYESSVRLTHVSPDQRRIRARWPIAIGASLIVVTVPLAAFWIIGYGLAVVGGVLLVFGLMELPPLPVPPRKAAPVPTTPSFNATAEYLAITPLLGIAAIALAALVDAALSRGPRYESLGLLIPIAVLGTSATLMTSRSREPARQPPLVAARIRWGLGGGLASAVTILLILIPSPGIAAPFGFALWLIGVAYTSLLFLGPDRIRTRVRSLALSLPVAIVVGFSVFLGVHGDLGGVTDTLGVFGLVNIALAFALAVLYYAIEWSLKRQPPRLIAWIGVEQLPIVAVAAACWVGASLVVPDTLHDVRLTERRGVSTKTRPERRLDTTKTAPHYVRNPDGEALFKKWLAAQPELKKRARRRPGTVPLFLVAAHGGGIRAAYWTALALDCIVAVAPPRELDPDELVPGDPDTCTDDRRSWGQQRAAARRILIASGVSGGAVGLYAYARQLLATGNLGKQSWVKERLGHDFASSVIGWGVFHDLPNHILGLHSERGGRCTIDVGQCLSDDRAAVLDEAFDRVWPKAGPLPQLRHVWDLRSADARRARKLAQTVPLIVTNATVTGGGTRAIVSAANLAAWPELEKPELASNEGVDPHPLAGTVEAVDALCSNADLRLSSAALLGSRFPYVEPSGHISSCRGATADGAVTSPCAGKPHAVCDVDLVDGGYTDNSGLFTIDALLPSLRQRVIEFNAKSRRNIAIVVLQLDNHYQPSLVLPPRAAGGGGETFIPLMTALGGRRAIETVARAAAFRLTPPGCTLTVAPALHPGLLAPLGWELSAGAQEDLAAGLTKPRPNARKRKDAVRPVRQLRRLQAWIGRREDRFRAGLAGCIPRN